MRGKVGPLGRNTPQNVHRKQLLLIRNVRIVEQLKKSSGQVEGCVCML